MATLSAKEQAIEINRQIVATERDISSLEEDMNCQHENIAVLKRKLIEVFNSKWPVLKIIRN